MCILIDGSDVVNYVAECVRIFYDEIGKNFAVKRNIGLFELKNERAVGETLKLDRFGDPRDPKRPDIAFPVFPSGKGIFTGMEVGLLGDADQATFGHPVAGIGFQYFFMFCVTGNSSFDSHIK